MRTCKTIDYDKSCKTIDEEREKIEKYLRRELQKIWNVNITYLGVIPNQFDRLKETGITAEIGQVRKTVLLRMAGILRKVLKL